MNFKTTLVLLLLLVAIAGAYLGLRGRSVPAGQQPPVAPPASLMTGRDFTRITIDRDGPTIELRFEDGRWFQTQPVRFPVTNEAVESLINTVLSTQPVQSLAVSDDATPIPADLGLNPDVARIELEGDGQTHVLHLGRATVTGNAYVQVDDEPNILVIDSALHERFLRDSPRDWRPLVLPTLPAEAIASLRIDRGGQPLVLNRGVQGWTFGDKSNQRADAAQVQRISEAVAKLRTLGYASDDPKRLHDYGLDTPRMTVRVANAAGDTQTLRIGRQADLEGRTLYATWSDTPKPSPVVFTLAADLLNPLSLGQDQLRDPRLVLARAGSVRGIRINRVGRDALELRQADDGEGFVFVEPQPGYQPDPQLVQALIDTLLGTRAIAYRNAPREARAPLATVELALTGDRVEHLRLYADPDNNPDVLLAVRENESIAATVPSDTLKPLMDSVLTLRDRRLGTPGPFDTVRLVRDDGHTFRFVQDPDGTWALEGYDPWESETFAELLAWLRAPVVEQWSGLGDLPRGPIARLFTGNDSPAYVVNVEQGLAQRTDMPAVFRLPGYIVDRLRAEYRPTTIVPLSISQMRSVTFSGAGKAERRTFLRDAQGRYIDRQSQPVPEARVGRLFDLLAGLRTDRIRPAEGVQLGDDPLVVTIQPVEQVESPAPDAIELTVWPPTQNNQDATYVRLGRDKSGSLYRLEPQVAHDLMALTVGP